MEYPYLDELANALTHGVGAVLFLVLNPILIAYAVQSKDARKVLGAAAFSFGLLAVYFSSTIYHAVPDMFSKNVLNYFDYLSIFLLIAGSYTPFLLIYFRGQKGRVFLFMIWGLTILGINYEMFFREWGHPAISLIIFLALGWFAIFIIVPMLRRIKTKVLWLLLAGGLMYSSGTYFFYNDEIQYYHAIWHVFVLFGSLTHWVGVLMAIKDKKRDF
ncbi:MAG: PAQR family membrane homeostasis protein TrhA [Chitinophagales bacterium]